MKLVKKISNKKLVAVIERENGKNQRRVNKFLNNSSNIQKISLIVKSNFVHYSS